MSADNINLNNSNNTISNELFDNVVADYSRTQSVRKSAKNCNTSDVTAQRILITAGLWSSKSSRQAAELLEAGMTPDQIAKELCLTRDAVYTYMPYSRGMYGTEQTDSSQYSKEYRDRMAKASEGMSHLSADVVSLPKNVRTPENSDSIVSFSADSESIASGSTAPEGEDIVLPESDSVYALHLSLTGDFLYGADENLGLDPEKYAELLRLAKAEKGISRDILVPGNMNLHSLHYAIQKLFGWQNSHLHNYSLSQDDFQLLTDGRFGEYIKLCGALFRFPDEDLNDAYWDDDYETGVSVKTWFKQKYSAPFRQLSVGDSYLGNQWKIEEFKGRFPDFTDDVTLRDITRQVVIEQDFNYLIERLSIKEVFQKISGNRKQEELSTWKNRVSEEIDDLQEKLSCWNIDRLKDSASQLRIWRGNMDYIDKMKLYYPDSYKKEIRKTFGRSYDKAVAEHKEGIAFWTKTCMNILQDFNISLQPYFDTLYYLYDYGDDWCVKITLKEIYRKSADGSYVDSEMRPAGEALADILDEVYQKGKPACIASDGLNLVDDCGGIYGYINMLQTISGSDKEEANEMRSWARGLGWTGRKSKPENML